MSERKPYKTDVSDEQWALIEPVIAAWKAAHRGLPSAACTAGVRGDGPDGRAQRHQQRPRQAQAAGRGILAETEPGSFTPPRDHASVTTWIRTYDDESEIWSYFELDDEEWPLRHVDLQGLQRCPVTAASLAGVIEIRDHGDLAAMAAYERQYGALAEGTLHGWQEVDGAAEITRQEFESTWAAARETLDADRTEETS